MLPSINSNTNSHLLYVANVNSHNSSYVHIVIVATHMTHIAQKHISTSLVNTYPFDEKKSLLYLPCIEYKKIKKSPFSLTASPTQPAQPAQPAASPASPASQKPMKTSENPWKSTRNYRKPMKIDENKWNTIKN